MDPSVFWLKEFQNPSVFELNFPPLHPLDSYLTHEMGRVEGVLDFEVNEQQLLAAWVTLLCRYGRAEDVLVAVAQPAQPDADAAAGIQ